MVRGVFIAFVAALVAVSLPAHAQPGAQGTATPTPAPPMPGNTSESEWYGWRVGLVDAGAGLIYLSSFSSDLGSVGRGFFGVIGAGCYLVASGAHGRHSFGRVLLSLALRSAAITLALSIGERDDVDRNDVSLYLPIIAVSILDIGWLARVDKPRPPPAFAPYAAGIRQGGVIGVGGSF